MRTVRLSPRVIIPYIVVRPAARYLATSSAQRSPGSMTPPTTRAHNTDQVSVHGLPVTWRKCRTPTSLVREASRRLARIFVNRHQRRSCDHTWPLDHRHYRPPESYL